MRATIPVRIREKKDTRGTRIFFDADVPRHPGPHEDGAQIGNRWYTFETYQVDGGRLRGFDGLAGAFSWSVQPTPDVEAAIRRAAAEAGVPLLTA